MRKQVELTQHIMLTDSTWRTQSCSQKTPEEAPSNFLTAGRTESITDVCHD